MTTTATDWLAKHPDDAAEFGKVIEGAGYSIKLWTALPKWMQEIILLLLGETFEEPYWDDIHETTGGDAEKFLEEGLTSGWSIPKMSKHMAESFKGGTSQYARRRAKKIAITEAGHALNGARDASLEGWKGTIDPEISKDIRKSWHSVLADTTRDEHAIIDGVPADSNGLFSVYDSRTGERFDVPWPSHTKLPGNLRINCWCTILTEFGMTLDDANALIAEYEERVVEYKRETGKKRGRYGRPGQVGGSSAKPHGDNVSVTGMLGGLPYTDEHLPNLAVLGVSYDKYNTLRELYLRGIDDVPRSWFRGNEEIPKDLQDKLSEPAPPTVNDAVKKIDRDFSDDKEGLKKREQNKFDKGVNWAENKLTRDGKVLVRGYDHVDRMVRAADKKQEKRLDLIKMEMRRDMVYAWSDQVYNESNRKEMEAFIDGWDDGNFSPIDVLDELRELGPLTPKDLKPFEDIVSSYKEREKNEPLDSFWLGVGSVSSRLSSWLKKNKALKKSTKHTTGNPEHDENQQVHAGGRGGKPKVSPFADWIKLPDTDIRVSDGERTFNSAFNIDDRWFDVESSIYRNSEYGDGLVQTDFIFGASGEQETYGITNKGQAMKVFRRVAQEFVAHLKKTGADVVTFTASTSYGKSRSKLYEFLVRKASKLIPGFKGAVASENSTYTEYAIFRDSIDIRNFEHVYKGVTPLDTKFDSDDNLDFLDEAFFDELLKSLLEYENETSKKSIKRGAYGRPGQVGGSSAKPSGEEKPKKNPFADWIKTPKSNIHSAKHARYDDDINDYDAYESSFLVDGVPFTCNSEYDGAASIVGCDVWNYDFEDDEEARAGRSPYGVTGKGNAMKVFRRAVQEMITHIKNTGCDMLAFSARGDSRRKLYDFLVKKASKMMPGWRGGISYSGLNVSEYAVFRDDIEPRQFVEIFKSTDVTAKDDNLDFLDEAFFDELLKSLLEYENEDDEKSVKRGAYGRPGQVGGSTSKPHGEATEETTWTIDKIDDEVERIISPSGNIYKFAEDIAKRKIDQDKYYDLMSFLNDISNYDFDPDNHESNEAAAKYAEEIREEVEREMYDHGLFDENYELKVPEPPPPVGEEPKADATDDVVAKYMSKVENVDEIEPTDMDGSSAVYIANYKDGTKAVYKPSNEEMENVRMTIADGQAYKRDAAAYEVSRVLGMDDMVPPTSVAELEGYDSKGSVQEWREGTVAKKVSDIGEWFPSNEDDTAKIAAFDFLIGNTDRHPGNWLVNDVDGDRKVTLVDNGLSFPSVYMGTERADWHNAQAEFDRVFKIGFVGQAQSKGLDIPEEVKEWGDKWPEIRKVLFDYGLDDQAVNLAKARLDVLTDRDVYDYDYVERVWRSYEDMPGFKSIKHKPGGIDHDQSTHAGDSTKIDQTETAEFKKWFGDSKIVDGNGKPLVVYHGSPEVFTEFDTGMDLGDDRFKAAFFSDSSDVANGYSYHMSLEGKKRIAEFNRKYDERENTWLDIMGRSVPERDNARTHVLNEALDSDDITREQYDKLNGFEDWFWDFETADVPSLPSKQSNVKPLFLKMERPKVVDAGGLSWDAIVPQHLKKTSREDYDGIIFKNIVDNAGGAEFSSTTYAVFNPTQIKSAIGNSGAFDPDDPDITKNQGEPK